MVFVLLLQGCEDLRNFRSLLGIGVPAALHELQVGCRNALLRDGRPLLLLHHCEEDLPHCHAVEGHLRRQHKGTQINTRACLQI